MQARSEAMPQAEFRCIGARIVAVGIRVGAVIKGKREACSCAQLVTDTEQTAKLQITPRSVLSDPLL